MNVGCRWHFVNFGILEGHALPFPLFLYDDQGRVDLYFARFTVSVKLYVRSCEDDRDVGPRKANALTVTRSLWRRKRRGLASRGGCRKNEGHCSSGLPGSHHHRSRCRRKPDITVYGALIHQGKLASGDFVIITAARSGVGIAAVEIAKVESATSIAATRTAGKKKNFCPSVPITSS